MTSALTDWASPELFSGKACVCVPRHLRSVSRGSWQEGAAPGGVRPRRTPRNDISSESDTTPGGRSPGNGCRAATPVPHAQPRRVLSLRGKGAPRLPSRRCSGDRAVLPAKPAPRSFHERGRRGTAAPDQRQARSCRGKESRGCARRTADDAAAREAKGRRHASTVAARPPGRGQRGPSGNCPRGTCPGRLVHGKGRSRPRLLGGHHPPRRGEGGHVCLPSHLPSARPGRSLHNKEGGTATPGRQYTARGSRALLPTWLAGSRVRSLPSKGGRGHSSRTAIYGDRSGGRPARSATTRAGLHDKGGGGKGAPCVPVADRGSSTARGQ